MKFFYSFFATVGIASSVALSAQGNCNINTFPFSESFEDSSTSRDCWSQIVEAGNPEYDRWVYEAGSAGGLDYNINKAHSGLLNARLAHWAYSDLTLVKLVSPKFNITAVDQPTLSFYFSQETWGNNQSTMKVFYRLSESSPWVLLEDNRYNVANWTQRVISLPEKSNELQIAFEGRNGFGKAITVDDVVISSAADVPANTGCTPATASNDFENGNGDLSDIYIANDFSVNAHTNMTISQMKLNVIEMGGIASFDVIFYNSNDYGIPSEILKSYENLTASSVQDLYTNPNGFVFQENVLNFPEPLTIKGAANGGRFWVAVKVKNADTDTQSFWEATSIKNSASTAYYSSDLSAWTVIDGDLDGVFSFTGYCEATNPADNYCTPRFMFVEPLTYVKFGDTLENRSGNEDDALGYEDFRAMKAEVLPGQTYDITLEGNTKGDWESFFTVFVDWNRNGNLTEDGEVYMIPGSIENSNGEDGQQLTGSIAVPADALEGDTLMRVVKSDQYPTSPCDSYTFGQAEDYTLLVKKAPLATAEVTASTLNLYPNPAQHEAFIQSTKAVKNIEVFSMSGQKILVSTQSDRMDTSTLEKGIYFVKIIFEDGSSSTRKLFKK